MSALNATMAAVDTGSTVDSVDRTGNWLYRVGGISALTIGLGYLVIIPLFVMVGAPPGGGEEKLVYFAANASTWWAIIALSVFTDMLFIPVAIALYLALKHINKGAMLLAAACFGLFTALELAISWQNYAALINLSAQYTAATTEAQRAMFITVADYMTALLTTPLLAFYTILVPGIGIFLASLVMLKGHILGKTTAYIGLGAGIIALIATVGPFLLNGLDFTVVVVALFTTFWFLLAGFHLYRLSR